MGQRRLQDATQCRVTTGRLVLKALRVERVQEGQDGEMTSTHARSRMAGCRLHPMEKGSWKEDDSVSSRRGTEKVGSPEYELLEMVVIPMSLSVVPKVAELFCEDRFGHAAVGKVTGATGWDMEDEKQMKEVKRRVMDEEHGRTFDKLIVMIWIASKMNEVKHRSLLGQVRRQSERAKDEMFNDEMFGAKLDLDRGWILVMFFGMTRSDQLLEVRVLKSTENVSIALRSREYGEVQITNECREMRVDGADDDMSAILTQIHVSKQQFILIKFWRYATELCEEQCDKSDENDDIEDSEVSTNVRCKGRGGMNSNLESIIEELREWYHSDGDLCRTSTSYKVQDEVA